jgi:hypothetical protein
MSIFVYRHRSNAEWPVVVAEDKFGLPIVSMIGEALQKMRRGLLVVGRLHLSPLMPFHHSIVNKKDEQTASPFPYQLNAKTLFLILPLSDSIRFGPIVCKDGISILRSDVQRH